MSNWAFWMVYCGESWILLSTCSSKQFTWLNLNSKLCLPFCEQQLKFLVSSYSLLPIVFFWTFVTPGVCSSGVHQGVEWNLHAEFWGPHSGIFFSETSLLNFQLLLQPLNSICLFKLVRLLSEWVLAAPCYVDWSLLSSENPQSHLMWFLSSKGWILSSFYLLLITWQCLKILKKHFVQSL